MYQDRDAPPTRFPPIQNSGRHQQNYDEPQPKRGRGFSQTYHHQNQNNNNFHRGQAHPSCYPYQNNNNNRPPPNLQHYNNSRGGHNPRPFSNNFSRGRGYHHQNPRQNNFRPQNHRHTPTQQNHQEHQKDSPWMTPDLLKLIQEKEELGRICNENKSEDNFRNFKIKRFEVNMAVNDAKILFYQENPQLSNSYTQVFRRTSNNTVNKFEFFCEPCDKEFRSQEQLDEHKTEHITCKLDGCTYTAHVKLVMKHIEIQHSTNLFQRIKGYDTPEGIEKWKLERKKNFPTPENIVRKKAEISERKVRGDKLTAKEDFPGIEVFRHKIVPEERKRRRNNNGLGYQSDGDEDVILSFRKQKHAEQSSTSSFLSLNKSPAIKLFNFYTDIVISENGTVIGSTRETWMNQSGIGCSSEFKKSHDDFDEDENNKEFNITDDEDDTPVNVYHQSANQNSLVDNKSTTIVEKDDSNESNNKNSSLDDVGGVTTTTNRITGLVGYDESEVDSEEDGEIKSDKGQDNNNLLLKVPNIDPPLSSDDEAPDEIPAIISKDACCPPLSTLTNLNDSTEDNFSLSQTKDYNITNNQEGAQKCENLSSSKKFKRTEKKSFVKVKQRPQVQKAKSVRRKYTLLQRLLAPDIRREKNMVLQVCRFLVDRNFLDPDLTNNDTVKEEKVTIQSTLPNNNDA